MTRSSHRFRRIARLVGIILSSLILMLWILCVPTIQNRSFSVTYVSPTHAYSLSCGMVSSCRFTDPTFEPQTGWTASWAKMPRLISVWRLYGASPPERQTGIGADMISLPLWIPLLIVAVPTAIVWRRDRRRMSPGHCPTCHYNLTGNTSGICPECGTANPNRAEAA